MNGWLSVPRLTPKRVWFALAVAVVTDGLQLVPTNWLLVAQVLDVIAMLLISRAIGFHPLLLPTFVLELVPLADMLPTWVACTSAVIMFRRGELKSRPVDIPPPVITPHPPSPPPPLQLK